MTNPADIAALLPAAVAEEYRQQREALLQAFPELGQDEATLQDTLEGISSAPDLIASFIRQAREDEAMAGALKAMIGEMADRKSRLSIRAERRYTAAQRLMDACGLRKIIMPDFTAWISNTAPTVIVEDESALPDSVHRTVRVPDKAKIKAALAKGPVDGARMSNGGATLNLRVK